MRTARTSFHSNGTQSGVALIFVLGILTLLLVLGVTFVMNMTGENRMTGNFEHALRAKLASQAGIERAIAELQLHARTSATDSATEGWSAASTGVSYDTGAGISGTLATGARYALAITDGNSQINLNAGKDADLVRMLRGLPGLDGDPALASSIVAFRNTLPGNAFMAKEQVMKTPIDRAVYDRFKDFVTVDSHADPNAAEDTGMVSSAGASSLSDLSKSWPINAHAGVKARIFTGKGSGQERVIVSNASDTLLLDAPWAVIPDASSCYAIGARAAVNVNTARDETLGAVLVPVAGQGFIGALKAQRPIAAWRTFDSIVTDANVRNNANPNRSKPAARTTEFCFNGGGKFTIESSGKDGSLAEQRLRAVARIYSVWAESKKWQWARSPEFYRVTWLDTCPVDLSVDTGIDFPTSYSMAPDALKIGYWDNFQEDVAYTQRMWSGNVSGGNRSAGYDLSMGQMQFTNPSGLAANKFPEFLLAFKQSAQNADPNSEDSWNFNDFALRVTNSDDTAQLADPWAGEGDVGRIRFRSGGASYFAYVRNKGLKYVHDTDAPLLPDGSLPYTQQYIFETVDSEGNPTGNYEETGNKYTGRKFNAGFTVVQDLDGRPVKIPSGEAEKGAAVVPGPADTQKPQVGDLTFYVKLVSRAVFDLADSGPDGHSSSGAPGIDPASHYYLYPYTYSNPGSVRKAYRLMARDLDSAGLGQAVSLQVQDSAGTHGFPGSNPYTGGDGELNTWIRWAGLIGLKGNASLPAWDDIRIMAPDGNLMSAVLDAGALVRPGTVTWTNAASDETSEAVSVDVRAHAGTASPVWSYKPKVKLNGTWAPPEITRDKCTGQITVAASPVTNQAGRYLQYRVYLESRRVYSTSAGSLYLKATPVLEDITITYLPRAEILRQRAGD